MSVPVDNTGQHNEALSATTVTIGSFAVAGSNRIIRLSVSQWKASDTEPSATYNGTENFVVHDRVTIAEGAGVRRITLLRLVNPTVGAATPNIVVSWGGATVDEVVCGADSYTNADQTTPMGTAVKASGTSGVTSSVIVPNAAGDTVVDAISADAGGIASLTGNGTQRWRAIAAASTTEGAGQSQAGAGTDITSTWTFGSTGLMYTHIGVAIKQAAGGAVSAPAPMLLPAMRPTPKGLRGQVAMAMRALKPRAFDVVPSTVAQAAASAAMSTAFAIGVAIFSGTGATTAQSAAQALGTGIASGAGVTTAQSSAQAPATGIAAGAGLSVSQATVSAGSAPTGAGAGASTAQSLARATGAPTGAGGGCTTAQSTNAAIGSPTGAGAGISSSGGALCVAIGQAVVPGVGGVAVAQSTVVGIGAPTGAGGGCTTSVSTARATSTGIAAGAGTSSSQSPAIAGSAPTSAGAGISVAQSIASGIATNAGVQDWVVVGPFVDVGPRATLAVADPRATLTDVSPRATLTAVDPTNILTPVAFP